MWFRKKKEKGDDGTPEEDSRSRRETILDVAGKGGKGRNGRRIRDFCGRECVRIKEYRVEREGIILQMERLEK